MEHKTENMSISLPKELKERVKQRVREDHYGTPSDYLRSLIREDLRRCDQERLEQALLKGLDSGPGVIYGTKEYDDFKKGILKSIAKKKK
jgi:antitoxin ParD1/3/4